MLSLLYWLFYFGFKRSFIYKYCHACQKELFDENEGRYYTFIYIHIYIYIYIYTRCIRKVSRHSWKFSMLLLYILWDGWSIFMISGSNELLQQQLQYTLIKPGCHSWRISKMQSDTLEEQYAIKFCFKLGKRPQKRMECFRLLFDHLAWIEHQFLSGKKIFKEDRESVRDDERCGRSKEVNIPELIDQRVRVRVTMLRF